MGPSFLGLALVAVILELSFVVAGTMQVRASSGVVRRGIESGAQRREQILREQIMDRESRSRERVVSRTRKNGVASEKEWWRSVHHGWSCRTRSSVDSSGVCGVGAGAGEDWRLPASVCKHSRFSA